MTMGEDGEKHPVLDQVLPGNVGLVSPQDMGPLHWLQLLCLEAQKRLSEPPSEMVSYWDS